MGSTTPQELRVVRVRGRRTITIKLTGKARGALHNIAGVKLIVRATATDRARNTGPARVRQTTLRRR